MTDPSKQPAIRLPIGRLALILIAMPILVGMVVSGLAWTSDPALVRPCLQGAMSVLVGSAAGVLFLAMFKPRAPFMWGGLIISASMIRLVVALGLGVWLTLSFGASLKPLWITFLIAALPAHLAEVLVLGPALKGGAMPGKAVTEPSSEPLGA